MTGTYILLGLIVLIVIITVSAGVKIVPQSETRVVERLGRFHSVLSPGLNIIWPFIDKPKVVYTRRVETMVNGRVMVTVSSSSAIDLREQVYDFPAQQVITKDNVTTEINALLYFQIVDAKKPYTRSTICQTHSRN